jgi:hypothetical protein
VVPDPEAWLSARLGPLAWCTIEPLGPGGADHADEGVVPSRRGRPPPPSLPSRRRAPLDKLLPLHLSSGLLTVQRMAAAPRVRLGGCAGDGAVEVTRTSKGPVGRMTPLQVAPDGATGVTG